MANISVDITGNDKSASSAIENVGSKASSVSGRLSSMGERIGSVFGGIELHEAADKIVDFAKESVDKLSEVASTTRTLQRVLGGTPEQVSALAFAAEHMGVSATTLSTSAGIMSKGLLSGKSALTGLGIETKNSDGSLRSFTDLLPDIAEKFAGMTNSSQRTALAMQLFGRGGKDMLPLLMKGKDGIGELEEEASKLGLTMSGKSMDATYKYQMAQKALHAEIEGVQMKIGTALYPQLIKLTGILTSQVIPAVMAFFDWMSKNPALIKSIAEIIGPLVAGIVLLVGAIKVWTAVQGILDVVLDANPIGLIIVAVAALIAIVLLVVANWKTIWPFLQNLWSTIWGFLSGVFDNIGNKIHSVFDGVVGFLAGIWGSILSGAQSGWNTVIGFIVTLPGKVVAGWALIGSDMATVGLNMLQGLWNGITNAEAWLQGKIAGLAGNVVNWAKNALGIHSPSTVFHEIGMNVGQGFANGIGATTGLAQAAMAGMVSTPSLSGMGLSSALSGSQTGAVTAQAARSQGGVFIGTFNAGGMSPAAVGQELGWQGRWAT